MRKHNKRITLRFKERKKTVTIYYKEYKILIFDADTFYLGVVYNKQDGTALFHFKSDDEVVSTDACFKYIRDVNNKKINRRDTG